VEANGTINGGAVDGPDLEQFIPSFKAGKAGPSGLACAGTVPCQ
jgi:hypothetical protein